jgi:hypothetical protein
MRALESTPIFATCAVNRPTKCKKTNNIKHKRALFLSLLPSRSVIRLRSGATKFTRLCSTNLWGTFHIGIEGLPVPDWYSEHTLHIGTKACTTMTSPTRSPSKPASRDFQKERLTEENLIERTSRKQASSGPSTEIFLLILLFGLIAAGILRAIFH